jgi:sugar phosphate permease
MEHQMSCKLSVVVDAGERLTLMEQRRWRVRWTIFALLFGFAIFGYVQRTGTAIAADRMLPELGLTQIQFGWLLNAFLIAYTALQVPGALAGQWLGPRLALGLVGLVSTLASSVGRCSGRRKPRCFRWRAVSSRPGFPCVRGDQRKA